MRFLADMGISTAVVRWLRSQGHDAVHLREENLHRLSDPEIFQKAIKERRYILTVDLDFGEIVSLNLGPRVSVITFRLHNSRSLRVIERLANVLQVSSEVLEEGAVITVEVQRHRVRVFPDLGPWV
jgi:predicted nuclease of predicted toxin-antitoxin system